MKGKVILVTGGSRSGKSEFAEKLVCSLGPKCAYIATAEILDEEMRVRVHEHRKRRESDFWLNYEAPFCAHEVMEKLPDEVTSILFDCVTMYLTNLIYGKYSTHLDETQKQQKMFATMNLLLAAAKQSGKNVVFVTNELGSGIVPFNEMSREFRDLAGQANQLLAKEADEAYLVVSGIAIDLKKLAVNIADRGE